MKKLVMILVAGFFMSGVALAQNPTCSQKVACSQKKMHKKHQKHAKLTPEQHTTMMVARMAKTLSLTEVQKKKITLLATDMRQKMEVEKKKVVKERKVRRVKMKAVRASFDKQIKSILSPAQYEKYLEQRAKKNDHACKKSKKNKRDCKAKHKANCCK